MQKTKNQHYVPRMYIKRFAEKYKKKYIITVLKKSDNSLLKKQNPENFAAQRYFYDVDKAELEEALIEMCKLYSEVKNHPSIEDKQSIEHMLSRQEYEMDSLFNEFSKNMEKVFEDENKLKLILFIHTLAYRTKAFRDNLDCINKQRINSVNRLNFDDNAKKKFINEQIISGRKTQLYELVGIRPILKTLQMLILNYDWYIADNHTDAKLIISDDPARMFWLGFNDICFPISPTQAIIFKVKDSSAPKITNDEIVDNHIELSLKSVMNYNLLQISHAQEYIFGDYKTLVNIRKLLSMLRKED